MASVLLRHKVKDYAAWRTVFDGQGAILKTSGAKSGRVFHTADSNEIVVLLEFRTADVGRTFVTSEKLRKEMVRAGVLDRPDIYVLEELDKAAL